MITAEKAASLSHQEKVALLLSLQDRALSSERQLQNSQKEVVSLQQKTTELKQKAIGLKQETTELKQQLAWFQRQLFGQKSEKRRLPESPSKQLELGLLLLDSSTTPPDKKTTVTSYERTFRKKSQDFVADDSRLKFDSSVPVERIEVPNPELEGLTEDQYEVISEKSTYRLAQRPAAYVVLEYVQKVVKLKKEEGSSLSQPPLPPAIIEKSFADVSFLSGLAIDKCLYHLPLYRQHLRLTASGVYMNRTTLTKLIHRTAELLEPIYLALLSSILTGDVITMDETPIKAGKAKGKMKTGYFWPIYGENEEVVFLFSPSRGQKVVEESLVGFQGTLLTDGYSVYERYALARTHIVHAQCWSHTRRKFEDAFEKTGSSHANKILDYIELLYAIEEHARDSAPEKRRLERETKSAPIVDEIVSTIKDAMGTYALLPSDPYTKAARYLLHRETALRVYLRDPCIPIDTNHLERLIRVIAMGRKNWMFCSSEAGARVLGILQSLITTCKLQGVNAYTYLVDVLQRIDTHPVRDVHLLTPRLWKEEFGDNPLRSDLVQLNQ